MDLSIEALSETFLRTCLSTFTASTFQKFLSSKKIKVCKTDIEDFLDNEPLVFRLSQNEYITRAGVFSDAYFSIRPSKYEIDHNILIIGHRCMPFIDPEMLPHELTIYIDGKKLRKTMEMIPVREVSSKYYLYGDEYVPQYVSFDPANKGADFSQNDFELPQIVKLTVFDMKSVYSKTCFKFNDRLLLKVVDWDTGCLEMKTLCDKKANPFEQNSTTDKRQEWFQTLEKATLDSFEIHGPCENIDEQLSWVIAENRELLCIPECGSIEELVDHTKKIVLSIYGVETRLWKFGEEVPATGIWDEQNQSSRSNLHNSEVQSLFYSAALPVPETVTEIYLYDSLYRKDKSIYDVFKRIVPNGYYVNSRLSVLIMLQLAQKRDIIRNDYNWFADCEIGAVRSRALQLYSKLISLLTRFGLSGLDVQSSPQQSVVVMSQLFIHATRLVESFRLDVNLSENERNAILLSLEGMEYSFQDIEADLLEAIDKYEKHNFSIINKTEDKNG